MKNEIKQIQKAKISHAYGLYIQKKNYMKE